MPLRVSCHAPDGNRFDPEIVVSNAGDVQHLRTEVLSQFVARELGFDRGNIQLTVKA
jgi:hypothetical protein